MAADESLVRVSAPPQRQRRLDGGRPHKYTVRLSDEEQRRIEDRARAAGVSVPRMLVEAAVASGVQSTSERRALVVELCGARRLVAAAGNHLHELVRVSEAAGQVPSELASTLDATARVIGCLEAAVQMFGGRT